MDRYAPYLDRILDYFKDKHVPHPEQIVAKHYPDVKAFMVRRRAKRFMEVNKLENRDRWL